MNVAQLLRELKAGRKQLDEALDRIVRLEEKIEQLVSDLPMALSIRTILSSNGSIGVALSPSGNSIDLTIPEHPVQGPNAVSPLKVSRFDG